MENDWSKDAISFKHAKKHGHKLGSYLDWKHGLPGELWELEVYEVNGLLYGGVKYMKKLEPMLQNMRKKILAKVKKYGKEKNR